MQKQLSVLEQLTIASPCSASWDDMAGDATRRFCSHCQLHVYNVSEMPRSAAEDLILRHEGHLCVRLYRRQDGTLLTRDCPVGLARLKRSLFRSLATAASVVALLNLWAWGLLAGSFSRPRSAPLTTLLERIQRLAPVLGTPPPIPMRSMGMMVLTGRVACPTVQMGGAPLPVQPPAPQTAASN